MKNSLRVFYCSFLRLIKQPRFYIAIIIGVLLLLSERWIDYVDKFILGKNISKTYSFAFMLEVSLSYTIFPFIFVPLCTISGSLAFCEDTSHNFYRAIWTRVSKKTYAKAQALASAVIGGLTGASIIIFSALLLRVIYPSHSIAMQTTAQFGALNDPIAIVLNGWGYVIKIAFVYFFGGMALAVFGLLCSSFAKNRYVAVLAPLILFISADFLMGSFHLPFAPMDLLMTYDSTSVSVFTSAAIFTLGIYMCTVLFTLKCEDKVGE
ncbi:hypothetical protein IMX26_06790 [Clostridium sp. 'deep sea']|uniref:hypothetical protein n=1 Tax=Clostridium sp. 'deep sea' TaxID=2779445 RepID=UPI0018966B7E|nr:hypothetical protein [Clostridium sp. 'deep sea']QOR36510.1 hypothetical protein IMX26_06790 [Clostridium sp. 'deep sea']